MGLAELIEQKLTANRLTIGIGEIIRQAQKPLPWIIEKQLIANTLTVIYGPPKQYKTFVAIDMALSQATGQPFLGTYKVLETGLVIYAAGEGVAGVSQRVLAWCKDRGIDDINEDTVPFRRTKGPIQITSGGAAALAEECAQLSLEMDLPIAGIYIDTLARNFGQGDESKTQDMSLFVQQCDYHLRERFGAAVVIVHHTGHDNANRARGSIVLMASADSQIKVSCDFPDVYYQPDFMKDAEAPEARVLTVEKVPLGFDDQFGEPVKSIVLKMTDKDLPTAEDKLSQDEVLALGLLTENWKPYEIWRDDFIHKASQMPISRGKKKGNKRCNGGLRSAMSRVVNSLDEKGLIEIERCNDFKAKSVRATRDTGVLQQ